MKRIKILYAGALVALSFSSVGCNDSESDLLEPKLYFESNVIRVEVEAIPTSVNWCRDCQLW